MLYHSWCAKSIEQRTIKTSLPLSRAVLGKAAFAECSCLTAKPCLLARTLEQKTAAIEVFLIWIVTGMFDGFGDSAPVYGELPCDFPESTLLLQYLLSLNVMMVGGVYVVSKLLSCSSKGRHSDCLALLTFSHSFRLLLLLSVLWFAGGYRACRGC